MSKFKESNEDRIWYSGDSLALGTCLFYYLPADIIMIITSVPPAWSLHDCPIPANEAGSARPWYLSSCQNLASTWLPLVQVIYLFIFINRNIRSLFLPDTANTLMNMPVKMKMKAPVNYLLEHSARQINSNKKREVITADSTCQCVDLRSCLQGS